MRFGRVATAVVCTIALALGLVTLVTVSRSDSRAHTANLNAYANTVCGGLAAPAGAYRSMLQSHSRRGRPQNVGLKAWYTAYFDTMTRTVRHALSTLEHYGEVDGAVADTDNALKLFFGNARTASTASQRGIATLDPGDPAFDARIDQLTGGPIAPERFNDMFRRAKADPRLSAAMRLAPTCRPAAKDLQLIVHGRMLDLLFSGTTPV